MPKRNMLEIHSHPPEEVFTEAVRELQTCLHEFLAKEHDILLLLSGGANIEVAKQAGLDLLNNPKITCMVLDERFSQNPSENNSLLLQAEGIPVIPSVPEDAETLEAFGARFAALLKEWLIQHPNGKVVCTLGMGPDGHIAGISPLAQELARFRELFVDNPALAVGYPGKLTPAERVTVTAAFLRLIDVVLAFIAGESKQEAFSSLFDSNVQLHEKPVKLLRDLPGRVVVTTDLATGRTAA